MLDYIWGGMILISVVVGVINGSISELGSALIDSAGEAITLGISIVGVISLWTGITKVAEEAGLIDLIGRKMRPMLHWLFPNIPRNHSAMKHIAANIIANLIVSCNQKSYGSHRAKFQHYLLKQRSYIQSNTMSKVG